jgi:hypothetical protein
VSWIGALDDAGWNRSLESAWEVSEERRHATARRDGNFMSLSRRAMLGMGSGGLAA